MQSSNPMYKTLCITSKKKETSLPIFDYFNGCRHHAFPVHFKKDTYFPILCFCCWGINAKIVHSSIVIQLPENPDIYLNTRDQETGRRRKRRVESTVESENHYPRVVCRDEVCPFALSFESVKIVAIKCRHKLNTRAPQFITHKFNSVLVGWFGC